MPPTIRKVETIAVDIRSRWNPAFGPQALPPPPVTTDISWHKPLPPPTIDEDARTQSGYKYILGMEGPTESLPWYHRVYTQPAQEYVIPPTATRSGGWLFSSQLIPASSTWFSFHPDRTPRGDPDEGVVSGIARARRYSGILSPVPDMPWYDPRKKITKRLQDEQTTDDESQPTKHLHFIIFVPPQPVDFMSWYHTIRVEGETIPPTISKTWTPSLDSVTSLSWLKKQPVPQEIVPPHQVTRFSSWISNQPNMYEFLVWRKRSVFQVEELSPSIVSKWVPATSHTGEIPWYRKTITSQEIVTLGPPPSKFGAFLSRQQAVDDISWQVTHVSPTEEIPVSPKVHEWEPWMTTYVPADFSWHKQPPVPLVEPTPSTIQSKWNPATLTFMTTDYSWIFHRRLPEKEEIPPIQAPSAWRWWFVPIDPLGWHRVVKLSTDTPDVETQKARKWTPALIGPIQPTTWLSHKTASVQEEITPTTVRRWIPSLAGPVETTAWMRKRVFTPEAESITIVTKPVIAFWPVVPPPIPPPPSPPGIFVDPVFVALPGLRAFLSQET